VITQLEIAQSLGYIDEFDSCNELAQEVGRMLTSLMKKYDSIRSTTTTTHYN
jgi:four helix bundle protein